MVLCDMKHAAHHVFDRRIDVHLVPNAVGAAELVDQIRSYNTAQPLRLVYVGRLVRTKSLFEVIEALTHMKRAGREFRLSIAGGGSDMSELVVAMEKAGLLYQVMFLGSVFDEEKNRLWLRSDLFVLSTFYGEGLPYSSLEVLTASCVPITTPVSSISEVMRDGEHGLFVPPKDIQAPASAVAALDDDRKRMVRTAEAARRRVAAYHTRRLADDSGRLYLSRG